MKKIGILCYYQFPEGMAPTTRIIAYGKGLVRNNVETEVIIFRPLHTPSNYPKEGSVEGVHYIYTHSRNRNISRLKNIVYDKPLSVIKTIRFIKKSNRKKKYDCILLSFDNIFFMSLYITSIWFIRIPMLFIGDEYPIPIREKLYSDIPTWKKIAYRILHQLLRGRILMTDALKNYYNKIASVKPTHILPTIVDVDRFMGIQEQKANLGNPYLCYMGNMELAKDNVDNIIRAFHILKHSPKYNQLELHLYGTPSLKDKKILEDLINKLDMNKSVFIMGRAQYSDVPDILAHALVLVTSQPNTKRAEGGFPTKLGEYLLSNRPAIVTNVGEISDYIKDGVNAYLVEPNDPEAYAKKLDYILNNPQEAIEVAKRGRAYIFDNFSCEKISADMICFMNSLL